MSILRNNPADWPPGCDGPDEASILATLKELDKGGRVDVVTFQVLSLIAVEVARLVDAIHKRQDG